MHLVMKNHRGTAVRVDTGVKGANLARVKVKGTDIKSGGGSFVITGATIAERENVQLQPSTSDKIYAYAFGRAMGQLTLSGMAFPQMCKGQGGSKSGIKLLFDEYEKSRFSKNFKPLQITISKVNFSGFLIGCRLEYADAAHSIATWTLEFVTYRKPETTTV